MIVGTVGDHFAIPYVYLLSFAGLVVIIIHVLKFHLTFCRLLLQDDTDEILSDSVSNLFQGSTTPSYPSYSSSDYAIAKSETGTLYYKKIIHSFAI